MYLPMSTVCLSSLSAVARRVGRAELGIKNK